MSRLRARCPDCRTFTAVALGPEYECHSCGRVFARGPRARPAAWGDGGEAMAEAAFLQLPYPEAARDRGGHAGGADASLLAADLPDRPLVLGGCCCSHVGAVEGLAARQERLAVVWLDAHGDLNTPETSPSGNAWGMPLRMVIDSGAVAAKNVALVGARNLDPPEEVFIAASGLHRTPTRSPGHSRAPTRLRRARRRRARPGRAGLFMPEPDGLSARRGRGPPPRSSRAREPYRGAGLTGLVPTPTNEPHLARLAAALGSVMLRNPGPVTRSKLHDVRAARIDVSIEHKQAPEPPDRPRSTRTRARSATRTTATTSSTRRSASARSAATTSRCGRARASRSSSTRAASSRRPPTSARTTRSTSSTSGLRRAARRGRAEDRPRRRDRDRQRARSRPAVRARGDGLRVHGRLDGAAPSARSSRARARAPRSAASRSSRSPPRAARACRRGSSR